MNQTYASELVRRLAPDLQAGLVVQPLLPLHIKLQLERLRLIELIGGAREKPGATDPMQLESHLG